MTPPVSSASVAPNEGFHTATELAEAFLTGYVCELYHAKLEACPAYLLRVVRQLEGVLAADMGRGIIVVDYKDLRKRYLSFVARNALVDEWPPVLYGEVASRAIERLRRSQL